VHVKKKKKKKKKEGKHFGKLETLILSLTPLDVLLVENTQR